MKIYKKAVLPQGFKANGVSCGLKRSGKLDLALFYSEPRAKAACKFTANKIKAAPVQLDSIILEHSKFFHALIANSGNANAFCGKAGLRDAREMTRYTAQNLCLKKEEVLVASTGIIGKRLDVAKIKKAVPQLIKGLSKHGIDKAKKAIMTTDTFVKEITVRCFIGGKAVTVCGIAKGAGMIAPNTATMLCFIFTDACITQRALESSLGACVQDSFNCITVDGCMSTNDSVIALANSASNSRLISGGKDLAAFSRALGAVCLELAKSIVRDGEGASKFIRIRVKGAASVSEAKRSALSIANSNLFKCAMYGSSANIIGRIVAAIGASGVPAQEEGLSIKFSSLKKRDVDIEVGLGRGKAGAAVYTCDLSPEYVKINAEYN